MIEQPKNYSIWQRQGDNSARVPVIVRDAIGAAKMYWRLLPSNILATSDVPPWKPMEFHAEEAARVLTEIGFDASVIEAVQRINRKQAMRSDPDVQTMEDALCLSFVEHELEEFALKHDDEKLVRILRETWAKMSARGHALAAELLPKLSQRSQKLFERAIHIS